MGICEPDARTPEWHLQPRQIGDLRRLHIGAGGLCNRLNKFLCSSLWGWRPQPRSSASLACNAPQHEAVKAEVQGGDAVTATWADASDNEIGFRVERSADSGKTWTIVAYRPPRSQGH